MRSREFSAVKSQTKASKAEEALWAGAMYCILPKLAALLYFT